MHIININNADNFPNCSFEAKIKLPREVILNHHNEGKTTFQIAKLLTCSPQAVRKIIRDELKLIPNNPSKRGQVLYSREELKVLHEQGFTVKQIAQKWNACGSTIRNMLSKMGLKPNVLSTEERAKFDKNEIKLLYEKGLKTKEIAEQLNCAAATVRRLLNDVGIKLPRYSNGSTPQVSREEMAKLNEEGLTVSQIAKKMNCSYTLVSLALKKMGLEPNRVIKQPSTERLQYTPAQIVEFYKSGMTLSEIGALMGVHFSSVRNILLKENIELAKAGKPLKYSRNDLIRFHQEGLSINEISEKLGCTPQYVRKLHKNLGLLPNFKQPVPKYPTEQIVEQYKQGLSMNQIAKMFGCCHDTVKRSLKKHGISFSDRGSLFSDKPRTLNSGVKYSRDEVLRLHKEGLSAVAIAKEMGATDGTIRRILKALLNIPKDGMVLKNQVLELYHQNIPMNEIASRLDVKFDKVRKIIRDNNLIVQPSKKSLLQARVKNYHLLGYNERQISTFVRHPIATIRAIVAESEKSLLGVQKTKVGRPKKINIEQLKPVSVNKNPSPFANVELLIEQKYSFDEMSKNLGIAPTKLESMLEKINKRPFHAEGFDCVNPVSEQGRLRTLVSRGDSAIQIAELYGDSASNVKKWLKECCIDIPEDRKSPSKEQVEAVLEEVYHTKKSVGAVYNFGQKLGVSKSSFDFLVEKYGLEALYWSIIRGL